MAELNVERVVAIYMSFLLSVYAEVPGLQRHAGACRVDWRVSSRSADSVLLPI